MATSFKSNPTGRAKVTTVRDASGRIKLGSKFHGEQQLPSKACMDFPEFNENQACDVVSGMYFASANWCSLWWFQCDCALSAGLTRKWRAGNWDLAEYDVNTEIIHVPVLVRECGICKRIHYERDRQVSLVFIGLDHCSKTLCTCTCIYMYECKCILFRKIQTIRYGIPAFFEASTVVFPTGSFSFMRYFTVNYMYMYVCRTPNAENSSAVSELQRWDHEQQ